MTTEGRWPLAQVEEAVRVILAEAKGLPSPETAGYFVDIKISKLADDSGWSNLEVAPVVERAMSADMAAQRFKADENVAWFVFLGYFAWAAFVLVTRGLGQLANSKFWLWAALGFIPVNLIAYLLMSGVYSLVLRLLRSRPSAAVAGAAGCGCLLPILYVATSIALNRALYLWLMAR